MFASDSVIKKLMWWMWYATETYYLSFCVLRRHRPALLLKRLSQLRLFSCCLRGFVVRSSFFARPYCFAHPPLVPACDASDVLR